MKQNRYLLILIILLLVSSVVLSTSLARFSDEHAGVDTALVAKWNFGARGDDDDEFFNKGFTFDLFSAKSVKPMDFGEKSFIFTGGASDTGISYDVEMNVADLLWLVKGDVARTAAVDIYAPFIFKITAQVINEEAEEAADPAPQVITALGDWFRPQDIEADENGYFSIDENGYFSIFDKSDEEPSFSPGSSDQVKITVAWQWNTSFFINDTGAAPEEVEPKASTEVVGGFLRYYWSAYDEYYKEGGLLAKRDEAAQDLEDFLQDNPEGGDPDEPDGNGGSDGNGEPDGDNLPDGSDEGSEGDEEDSTSPNQEWIIEYNRLLEALQDATIACETSLMTAYDDYDTLGIDALVAKESVKVIFRITGEQVKPGQDQPSEGA